jgi:hypothetical protein
MKNRTRPDYDYNKPISVCSVCYTLGKWHCYDCNQDFCEEHYYKHKASNGCKN